MFEKVEGYPELLLSFCKYNGGGELELGEVWSDVQERGALEVCISMVVWLHSFICAVL